MAKKTISLDKFDGFDTSKLKDNVFKVIKDNCDETAEYLRDTSPRRKGQRAKKYKDGWVYKLGNENEGIVYNKTNWQLTWLLENGHLITNKRNGVGWASPRKHIEPAYENQKDKYIEDMRTINLDIDFK